jgi:hypothetical protein
MKIEMEASAVHRPASAPAADEIRLRRDRAACCRLAALFGWDDLLATHISVDCRVRRAKTHS